MSDGPLSRSCYLCGAEPGQNCHQKSGARCAPHAGRAPKQQRAVPRKELKRTKKRESGKARQKRAGHKERMEELRPQVFARDGYRCARCSRSDAELGRLGLCIQAHHRLMRSHGGPDTLENLITLCGPNPIGCHGWAHENGREAIAQGLLISREAGPPSQPWTPEISPEPLPRMGFWGMLGLPPEARETP